MTYKTISLNSKAFKLLKEEKRDNETYSEAIIRLATRPNIEKFLKLFGSLENDLTEKKLVEFKKEAHQAWN